MKRIIFLFLVLLCLLFSCGMPQYTVLEAPSVVDTGDENTLAFKEVVGIDQYMVFYKFYWPDEDEINDDEDVFDDTDSLSTGYSTPKSLDFIQFMGHDGEDNSAVFPVDTSDITLNTSGLGDTIILSFDPDGVDTVRITNADESVVYRRVLEIDNNNEDDSEKNVEGKEFFSADYDYKDTVSITGSETISAGSDGIDGDLYELFKSDRFDDIDNFDLQSLTVAVVVYSYGLDLDTFSSIESIPVYLGTVEIDSDDWYSDNPE